MAEIQVPTYSKKDFRRQMTWAEYGKLLDTLHPKLDSYLKRNKIKIDAIVPIYRAGGIAAQVLAYKLRQLTILPVQYKYLYRKGEIKLVKLNDSTKALKKKKPVLLVVENNHCFGTTARKAVAELKKKFPGSKILYVAVTVDYSNKEMPDADVVFFGKYTNETKTLTTAQEKKLRIQPGLSLFPWEDQKEELAAVTLKKFDYNDDR